MSSYFARLWQSIKFVSKRRLVGQDLHGNSFYETIIGTDINGNPRTRRTVQYKGSNEAWRAAENMHSLPVQWTAWLSYSRQNPPSIEELVNDKLRQQQLAENVAKLKAQDEEERRRQLETQNQLRQISSTQGRQSTQTQSSQDNSQQTPQTDPNLPSSQQEVIPSKPIGPTPEPQAWIPSATQRGSGSDHSSS